ncbi:phosphoribosylformylglycinamidine synthase subunit PurQ [Candidatus Micrarchaeota archaeon]|nr:phosphoribosylformylglycinamidine synthase subunit PurQ [Candidatus Micrarchaeota archaeon]
MGLKALLVSGYGINCEAECKYAIEKSGGAAQILHLNTVLENPKILENYNMFMIPGGFSFGDDLGSGKVFGNKIKFRIKDELSDFIKDDKLVLGICNGFQILVKMGLLPEPDFIQRTTLTFNDSGHYEDRWIILKANKNSPCIYTKDLEYLTLPVRHGEGKFIPKDAQTLKSLQENNQIVLQFVDEHGKVTMDYPANPNGAVMGITGICDRSGRVFGMMPHPDAFTIPENCPLWSRGNVKEATGLKFFKNAVDYANEKM